MVGHKPGEVMHQARPVIYFLMATLLIIEMVYMGHQCWLKDHFRTCTAVVLKWDASIFQLLYITNALILKIFLQ